MHILIPVDGSDASLQAVRQSLRDRPADDVTTSFTLLSVQPLFPQHLARHLSRAERESFREARARAQLAPALALLREAGVSFRAKIAEGAIGQSVIDEARRVRPDAIVIGVRRESWLRRALLPSISREILEGAPVPVSILSFGGSSRLSRLVWPAGIGLGLTALLLAD